MPKRPWVALGMMAVLAACGARAPEGQASSGPAEIVPRAALFGIPERQDARLSPDGKWVSYLERREGRTMLVAALIADRADARVLAQDVTEYLWSADGAFMLYRAAADGAWHAVDLLKTGEDRIVLKTPGVRFFPPSSALPDKIAFTLAPAGDLFELDIRTGARELIFRNRERYEDFLLDTFNNPRAAAKRLVGGDLEVRAIDGKAARLLVVTKADAPNTRFIGISPDGASLLLISTIARPRAALMRVDLVSGGVSIAAQDPHADIATLWRTPSTGEVEAYAAGAIEPRWTPLNQVAAADLATLKNSLEGAFEIVSRSADNTSWIVREQGPAIAPRVWLYNRAAKSVEPLFSETPPLDGRPMAPARLIDVPMRDGAKLPALLYTPQKIPADALVVISREPGALSAGAFDAQAQFFANRGFATLVVPRGGSGGFGRALAARNVATDAADAAAWAGSQNLAGSSKVVLIADAASAQSAPVPCVVAIADADDKPPIVDAGRRLLVVQRGVTKEKAAPVTATLEETKAPVALALFPDEGDTIARSENQIAFHALAGAFIAGCVGAKPEPIGADLADSTLQLPAGQKLIPTLDAAMTPRAFEAGAPP